MARRRKVEAGEKRKPVNFSVIQRMNAGKVVRVYSLMEELIKEHHPHLSDAKIVIAWRFGWRGDPDGRIKLGQMKKASDLDRGLHAYDFVMLLNHEVFNAGSFTSDMETALIDHELCHAAVKVDSDGEPMKNDEGKIVYRIRRHDVEEFSEIVARHGLWKADVKKLVELANEHDRPILAMDEKNRQKQTA